jgi:hypothetical protein
VELEGFRWVEHDCAGKVLGALPDHANSDAEWWVVRPLDHDPSGLNRPGWMNVIDSNKLSMILSEKCFTLFRIML